MNDRVILLDELNNEVEFQILEAFTLDGLDYMALLPVNEIDALTYLLRFEYDDSGERVLSGIDDEDELEAVIKEYEAIQNDKLQ